MEKNLTRLETLVKEKIQLTKGKDITIDKMIAPDNDDDDVFRIETPNFILEEGTNQTASIAAEDISYHGNYYFMVIRHVYCFPGGRGFQPCIGFIRKPEHPYTIGHIFYGTTLKEYTQSLILGAEMMFKEDLDLARKMRKAAYTLQSAKEVGLIEENTLPFGGGKILPDEYTSIIEIETTA